MGVQIKALPTLKAARGPMPCFAAVRVSAIELHYDF